MKLTANRGTGACALALIMAALPLMAAPKTPAPAKPAAEKAGAPVPKKPKSKRWQIGWAVDPTSARMPMKAAPTAIAHLVTFKRPKDLPGYTTAPAKYFTGRVKGVEDHIWVIKGTAISVAHERDRDYRLIVSDGKGNSVCCVMPDPAVAPRRGKYSAGIDAARAAVVARFHPTDDAQTISVPVEVTGFGYFGRMNPDENPSPEGFQLHPVFKVRFLDK